MTVGILFFVALAAFAVGACALQWLDGHNTRRGLAGFALGAATVVLVAASSAIAYIVHARGA